LKQAQEKLLVEVEAQLFDELFVVCPKPQNLYNSFALEHLIDNAVLNVDTTGIGSVQIADELFKWRWTLKGIFCQQG
jgi:hypothetical protein